MKITRETIAHVANLARLSFTEEELIKFTDELSQIVTYVDKLNELDTTGVEPTAHILPINNVFRDDVVEKNFDREAILQNAPEKENGCFKVPKIVE